mgnify:CR=1 FL=1
MGYSGFGIINGDLPMDVVSMIQSRIKVRDKRNSSDWAEPKKGPSIAQRLSDVQDELLTMVDDHGKQCRDYERYIPALVLGSVMMRYGAAINAKVMKAILNACDKDAWAKQELERKMNIDDFKEILLAYDHKTPTKDWKDHGQKFGIDMDELIKGRFSSKVTEMAMAHLEKAYRDKPWFGGIHWIFSAGGHALLMGIRFDKKRTPDKARKEIHGLYEVPLFFYDVDKLVVSRK